MEVCFTQHGEFRDPVRDVHEIQAFAERSGLTHAGQVLAQGLIASVHGSSGEALTESSVAVYEKL